jgi:hypothetical protein
LQRNQKSKSDERKEERGMVRPERFELPTFWFVVRPSS